MAEPGKCGVGSLLLMGMIGFLGALAGSIAGSLITFYVLAPAREAKAAVDIGVQGAKEGFDLIKQAIPQPRQADKLDANDKTNDPVEAVRFFFDNLQARRFDAAKELMKFNDEKFDRNVQSLIQKHPLPPREKALDKSEIKELAGIDDRTRIFQWTTTAVNGTKLEFRLILVKTDYKWSGGNPYWWVIERIDSTESPPRPEGPKKDGA